MVLARLDEILQESADLRVPLNLRPAYFELRQEMHDMRDRLTKLGGACDLMNPIFSMRPVFRPFA